MELHGARVGTLSGEWRTFDFMPDPTAVARFGIDNTILSSKLPWLYFTPRPPTYSGPEVGS